MQIVDFLDVIPDGTNTNFKGLKPFKLGLSLKNQDEGDPCM
jgi:hypothetical protein